MAILSKYIILHILTMSNLEKKNTGPTQEKNAADCTGFHDLVTRLKLAI